MDVILSVVGAVVAVAAAGALLLRKSGAVRPDGATAPAAAPAARPVVVVDTRAAPDADPGAYAAAAGGEPPELATLRLVRESQLVPEHREQLAAQLRALAMPPVGLQRLASADVMSATGARELGELVMAEPRLAAKVLARANSAFYGLPSPIKSIPHAVTYLGVPAVRGMALALLLADSFPASDPVLRRYHERTWSAALLTADLCNLLGAKLGVADAGMLATHAILAFLGDLGLPAIAGSEPDLGGKLDLVERLHREQDRLGVSSVLVGTILMQEWRLPGPMIKEVEAVGRLVVTPLDPRDPARAAHRGLVYACARLAEAIVRGKATHPAQLALSPATGPELHHLQGYLALPALARLPGLLASPEVATALARMMAAAGGTAGTADAPRVTGSATATAA